MGCETASLSRIVFLCSAFFAAWLVSFSFQLHPAAPLVFDSLPTEISFSAIAFASSENSSKSSVDELIAASTAAPDPSFNPTKFTELLPPPPRLLEFNRSNVAGYRDHLTSLREIDREYYTIRINTYQRHSQLALSVTHHMTCPGVAQIQIIWSEPEDPPPAIQELVNSSNGKVVLEYHSANSLNERFNITLPTPTLGILSMDDDILRPCVAIDAGFFQWIDHSHQIVGYDPRGHVLKNGDWYYRGDYQLNTIGYSMTLPRFCFLHRDYLHWYTTSMPQEIKDHITRKLNCEDLAMSIFVTKLTGGERPLMADHWARWSSLELQSHNEISNKKKHRAERSQCLNRFIDPIGVRHSMTMGPSREWNSSFTDEVDFPGNPRFQAMKRQWELLHSLGAVSVRGELKRQQVEMVREYWDLLKAWNATALVQRL